MARLHYYQWLTNQEGQPITNANIYVYLAGTTTLVKVYTSETGFETISTGPQLRSSNLGYFEFWIGDSNDDYGYDRTQKFKIKWERAGVETSYIDNITLFNTEIDEVDETDTGTSGDSLYKNKLVSNYLANKWNSAVDGSAPTELHIPDPGTTQDSFHVDTDGDTWWGCTVSDFTSDSDNAVAYILKDGTSKFQNIYIENYIDSNSLELELMKMNFNSISWAQFAIFDSFSDESKRATPDISTYDAAVYENKLWNDNDTTSNRSFGFISKTYTDITVVDSGTSTGVGINYLEDTSKSWFTDEQRNLTLIDSALNQFTINSNDLNTLSLSDTPAPGSYKIKEDHPAYAVLFCSFLDSSNGGSGYTKVEVSFNNGTDYQTFLDTENSINLSNGTVSITNPGDDYIARITLKNDSSGNGPYVYNFLICTDPSPWRW